MGKFKDATRRQSEKMVARSLVKSKKAAWKAGAKRRK